MNKKKFGQAYIVNLFVFFVLLAIAIAMGGIDDSLSLGELVLLILLMASGIFMTFGGWAIGLTFFYNEFKDSITHFKAVKTPFVCPSCEQEYTKKQDLCEVCGWSIERKL